VDRDHRRDIRGACYTYLEDATYIHFEDGRKKFAPTRRKIDDVVDALQSIVLLDSRRQAPMWIDGTGLPPAMKMISLANGVLHVPSRRLFPATPNYFVPMRCRLPIIRRRNHHHGGWPSSRSCGSTM